MQNEQIMPSANANKARKVFDNGKTVSYHVKSVVSCSQSAKNSASFKIIFKRDGGDKRYDFEAESPKLAGWSIYTSKDGIPIYMFFYFRSRNCEGFEA